MAQYSPRWFLRQASNELLRQYFDQRDMPVGVDWASLGESQIEPLWQAWSALPADQQQTADADFTDVSELANDGGVRALIQEATWHGLDLATLVEAMDDQVDMALWTFLNHHDVFRVAALFVSADSIASRSWHKWKGLPQRRPADDPAACEALGTSLRRYFVESQGRGRHCKVEVYQRAGRYYYFAFPEDYARAEQDFDSEGELTRRTHRPAFQVVFVYAPESGTLDASAPGGKRVVEKLMELAVRALVGDDRPDGAKDDRVYDLERLRDPAFVWRYEPGLGIAEVWVKALRLTFKADRDRIVIEANKAGAVHRRIDHLAGSPGERGLIDPASVFVTQAVIHIDYAPRGGRAVSPKEIRITWPNTCNLGQDEKDRALREMLIASGIDPAAIGRDAER